MFSIQHGDTESTVYSIPDELTFDEVWAVCVGLGWEYGAEFIAEDEFTDYIKELIEDCYGDLVNVEKSGDWPYRHVTVDYEAAADEAKADYEEVELAGTTYLVREM